MKEEPRKSLYYYWFLAIGIILILNMVVIPTYFNTKIKQIPYGTFLEMVDDGKLGKVEITDTKIAATANDGNDKEVYVTGRVEDPELVKRLVKSKVTFSQVIPREASPLENLCRLDR